MEFSYLITKNKTLSIAEILDNVQMHIKRININNIDDEIQFKNDVNSFYVKLGILFIDLFIQEPVNIFKLSYSTNKDNKIYTDLNKPLNLIVTENYHEELFTHLLIKPKNLPMVCEPNEWKIHIKGNKIYKEYGGFLENQKIKEDIITGSIKYNLHKIEGEGITKVYNSINYFNKIQFGINNSLRNYIQNEGSYLLNKMDKDTYFNSQISLKIANIFKNIPFYLHTHAD